MSGETPLQPSAGISTASEPRASGSDGAELRAANGRAQSARRVVKAHVQSETLLAERRESIVRAAISVFHRQGYHTTTTADIAREAGIAQSNLYNYVESKQDVLLLVCEHLVRTYDSIIAEVTSRITDPYARIVESLRAITQSMSDHKDELQLLYHETHALEKNDRVAVMGVISGFIDRFEVLVKQYETSCGRVFVKSSRLAANFLSFVPAILALRHWDLAMHKADGNLDEVVGFVLRGLGIREPAPC